MTTIFEWDHKKAAANVVKHRVGFETAALVFKDPMRITEFNGTEHGEWRWETIGVVNRMTLLVVVHTDRDEFDAEVIRIISARRATRKEMRRYGQDRSV